jgi:hypothetical protein
MLFSTSDLNVRQREILDRVDQGELVLLSRRNKKYIISEFHPAIYNKLLPEDFLSTPPKHTSDEQKEAERLAAINLAERRAAELNRCTLRKEAIYAKPTRNNESTEEVLRDL